MKLTRNLSEQSLVLAVSNPKIKDLENLNEVAVLLIKLFTLTSLKIESRPTQVESQFLANKIKSRFGMFTIEEIELAFDLGVTRDLERFFFKNESIKHFGTFSLEYFGSVMSAYKRYKSDKLKPVLAKASEQLDVPEVSDYDFIKFNFLNRLDKFKSGEYPWNYGADLMIFDILVKHGVVNIPHKEKVSKSIEVKKQLNQDDFEKFEHFKAEWSKRIKIHFFKQFANQIIEFDLEIEDLINNKIKK